MRTSRSGVGCVTVAAVLLGCHGDDSGSAAPRETTILAALSETAATTTPLLAPLAAEWMERLELDQGRIAYVAPPVGSTEPRPVVVAIHGAIDDAGLMCSAWRLIADVYPFVVCPAGTKVRKDTYVWPSSDAIAESIDRALVAVRAKFGDRVSRGPAVYVAFSQGANMAGPVLGHARAHPGSTHFGRAVLTEGGYGAFATATAARDFLTQDGSRVLFTCSQPGCAGGFAGSRSTLERAGGSARIVYAGSYGHSLRPEVRESIHDTLGWLLDGLEGWETYPSAPRLPSH